MKILFPLLFIVLLIGCEQKENIIKQEIINSSEIKNLVTQAIDSNAAANNKLSNLVDYSLPLTKNYNSVIVDSIITGNKIYYYVLLENPNPAYNRFAIYDSMLTPVFKDESLNGNIYLEKIKSGDKEFIKLDEAYLSKDTLLLNRLSLYSLNETDVNLIFRTHTKLAKPEIEYFQDIVEISDTLIKTKMSSSERSEINNKEDYFIYSSLQKKYSSAQNLFDEFIKKEISDFNFPVSKEELSDTTNQD